MRAERGGRTSPVIGFGVGGYLLKDVHVHRIHAARCRGFVWQRQSGCRPLRWTFPERGTPRFPEACEWSPRLDSVSWHDRLSLTKNPARRKLTPRVDTDKGARSSSVLIFGECRYPLRQLAGRHRNDTGTTTPRTTGYLLDCH